MIPANPAIAEPILARLNQSKSPKGLLATASMPTAFANIAMDIAEDINFLEFLLRPCDMPIKIPVMTAIAVPAFPSSSQDKLDIFFAAEAIIRVAIDKITMAFAVFFIFPASLFKLLETPINAPRSTLTPIRPFVSSSVDKDDNFLTAKAINNTAIDMLIKDFANFLILRTSDFERSNLSIIFTAKTSSLSMAPMAPIAFHISSEGIVVNSKIDTARTATPIAVIFKALA